MCHMVRDPNEDGLLQSSAPKPLVGCGHPLHDLKEAVAHTLLQKSHHLESLSLSSVLLALLVVRYPLAVAHTFSFLLANFASR